MNEKNITFNVKGGQVNYAQDYSVINATQDNNENTDELSDILKRIEENLKDLKKEDADRITNAVDKVKEELIKPEPKISRLKSSVALIAPMITIVNGIPILENNLQKLLNYLAPFIK